MVLSINREEERKTRGGKVPCWVMGQNSLKKKNNRLFIS